MEDRSINLFNFQNIYNEIINNSPSELDPSDLKTNEVSKNLKLNPTPPRIVFKDNKKITISDLGKEELKNCSEVVKKIWDSQNLFKENLSNELQLPEISQAEFVQAISCLKNKELINQENFLEVASIADQLEMPELLNHCDQFLATQFSDLEQNDDNLASVLSLISDLRILSLKTSYQKLVSYIESYLEDNAAKSISKESGEIDEKKALEFFEKLCSLLKPSLLEELRSSTGPSGVIRVISHLEPSVYQELAPSFELVYPNAKYLSKIEKIREALKKAPWVSLNFRLDWNGELEALTDLPIKSLDLSRGFITNKGLHHLKFFPHLTSLNLSDCEDVSDKGLRHLKELTNLKNLDLSSSRDNHYADGHPYFARITDKGLSHLKDLTNLNTLDLRHCKKITAKGLMALKELKNLTSLDLSGCNEITAKGLMAIKELTKLTSLDLPGCDKIKDPGLMALKELTNLNHLNLRNCKKITDEGVIALKKLKNLTSLDLSNCVEITAKGLTAIKELKNLTSLNLTGCKKITDECLKFLKKLKNLNTLNLSNCKKIKDRGLKVLKKLKYLNNLHLSGCNELTDEGLIHLKGLTNLNTLNLGNCDAWSHSTTGREKITDKGLMTLKELINLRDLNLRGCSKITDKGLNVLKKLKNLKDLNLRGCSEITDKGLRVLRKLKNLNILDLAHCTKITDRTVEMLKKLKNLKRLSVSGCENITKESLKELQSALPKLKNKG